MGFTNSTHDPCLFSRRVDDSILVVGVYVDDIIVSHNDPKHLEWFNMHFTGPNGFRAKHVGPLSWFLGVEVTQHFHSYLVADAIREEASREVCAGPTH